MEFKEKGRIVTKGEFVICLFIDENAVFCTTVQEKSKKGWMKK